MSSLKSPPAFLLLVPLVLLFHAGCNRPQPGRTVTYGSIGWNSADEGQSVPGIDQAMLSWHLRGVDLTYVVWTDLNGGRNATAGSGGGSSAGMEEHRTELETDDGGRFDFEYRLDTKTSPQADPGVITIDGVDFNLRDGALLVVSTQEGSPRIKQLKLNSSIVELLGGSTPSRETIIATLQTIAEETEDVNGFFHEAQPQN